MMPPAIGGTARLEAVVLAAADPLIGPVEKPPTDSDGDLASGRLRAAELMVRRLPKVKTDLALAGTIAAVQNCADVEATVAAAAD